MKRTTYCCVLMQAIACTLLHADEVVLHKGGEPSPKVAVKAVAGAYDENASGFTVDPSQIPAPTKESPEEFNARMAWWREARFGVMVTFGLFSIPAQGEWYMRWNQVPVAQYQEYAKQFNPVKFNAEEWVQLFKQSGAKYLVLIAKHHDGFAIWPSKASKWNIADATPYGKDLVGPLAEACRKEGIRFGIYYSQAQDWVNPGGSVGNTKPWDPAQGGDFDTYIDTIAVPQIRELAHYKPDIFWWDTPAQITQARAERLYEPLRPLKKLIMNSRLGGVRADFGCAEQMLPAYAPEGDWEACVTLGAKWAYAPKVDKQKPVSVLIRTLAEAVSKGGNLIYGFGPAPDGTFMPEHVERLKAIGDWLKQNGEAIYGCQASPFPYLSYGCATRKGNQLNLIVFDWPKDGLLRVPLLSGVKSARLAGTDRKLELIKEESRVLVKVPACSPDPVAGVVVLELDGEAVARPNPNQIAKVKASVNETDAVGIVSFKTKGVRPWITPQGTVTASLDFSFEKPVLISSIRLEEPDKFPRIPQAYTLESEVGGQWKKIADGVTEGRGMVVTFEPVMTSSMKLTLTGQNGAPGMRRMLFISPE